MSWRSWIAGAVIGGVLSVVCIELGGVVLAVVALAVFFWSRRRAGRTIGFVSLAQACVAALCVFAAAIAAPFKLQDRRAVRPLEAACPTARSVVEHLDLRFETGGPNADADHLQLCGLNDRPNLREVQQAMVKQHRRRLVAPTCACGATLLFGGELMGGLMLVPIDQ